MKKAARLLTLITVCGVLFFSSCTKDDGTDPDDPTADDQTKFKGNWAVSEVSKDFGSSTYNLTIADSSNASYVLIAYLYSFRKKTYATVNGNSMTIPTQIIEGNEVSGNGTLENSKRISLKYFVKSTKTHYDTVTAVLTK